MFDCSHTYLCTNTNIYRLYEYICIPFVTRTNQSILLIRLDGVCGFQVLSDVFRTEQLHSCVRVQQARDLEEAVLGNELLTIYIVVKYNIDKCKNKLRVK